MDRAEQLAREAKHWGDRLAVERIERHSWLDHPLVSAHYHERARVEGQPWDAWAARSLGGAAERSLELGCGSAGRSLKLYEQGFSKMIEGIDVSPDRVNVGEDARKRHAAAGGFSVGDVNQVELPPETYDLIFSCHSFHHFEALEHVMSQSARALTPNGLFVLEEFVGPTQFQWTDTQIDLVRQLTALLPSAYRMLRWNAIKSHEGRPTPAEVMAVSPFESIRSADIPGVFRRYFDVVEERNLGGTLQHLLYNGIIHNFTDDDPTARRHLETIWTIEDALIEDGLLPSDFQLLIGRAKT